MFCFTYVRQINKESRRSLPRTFEEVARLVLQPLRLLRIAAAVLGRQVEERSRNRVLHTRREHGRGLSLLSVERPDSSSVKVRYPTR